MITLYGNGPAEKTISDADCRAITDNVYSYASRGDYFSCADKALEQVLSLCRGERITRPVKHITNALIAVIFAVLVNYLAAVFSRRPRKDSGTDLTPAAGRASMTSVPELQVDYKLLSKQWLGSTGISGNAESPGVSSRSSGSSSSSGGSSHSGSCGSHRF